MGRKRKNNNRHNKQGHYGNARNDVDRTDDFRTPGSRYDNMAGLNYGYAGYDWMSVYGETITSSEGKAMKDAIEALFNAKHGMSGEVT